MKAIYLNNLHFVSQLFIKNVINIMRCPESASELKILLKETAALDSDETELVFLLPEPEPPQPTINRLAMAVEMINFFIAFS